MVTRTQPDKMLKQKVTSYEILKLNAIIRLRLYCSNGASASSPFTVTIPSITYTKPKPESLVLIYIKKP